MIVFIELQEETKVAENTKVVPTHLLCLEQNGKRKNQMEKRNLDYAQDKKHLLVYIVGVHLYSIYVSSIYPISSHRCMTRGKNKINGLGLKRQKQS